MEENKQIKQLDEINKFSLNIRRNILDMALSAGSSSAHLGGALSIADIVSVLFSFKMKLNKYPLRSISSRESKLFIPNNKIGIKILNFLFDLEKKFPKFFLLFGTFYIIEITQK